MTYEVSIEVRHHPRHLDDDAAVERTSFKLADYAPPTEMVADSLRTFADELHPASATDEPQGSSPDPDPSAASLLTERDADAAKVRESISYFNPEYREAFERLEAALVARDAELARWQKSHKGWEDAFDEQRERAEALEVERDELKSLFADNEDFVSRAVDARRELRAERDAARASARLASEVALRNAEQFADEQELREAAERLAHDRGEALREARTYVCEWPIGTTDDPQEQDGGPRDVILQVIDDALAGVVPPEQET